MSIQRFFPVRAGHHRHSREDSSKAKNECDETIITSTQLRPDERVDLADSSLSPINVLSDTSIVPTFSLNHPSCSNQAKNNVIAGGDRMRAPGNNYHELPHDTSHRDKDNHSTSSSSDIDECDLSHWGLYPDVLRWYQSKGINKMFPWQRDCLKSDGVLAGRSLVFSAPTSAGKTLVADILMIKQAYENRKKILVILPFISIIREKMLTLQSMLKSTHLKVGGFMGQHHTPGGFDRVDIAICTVEKANNYVLRLLHEKRLDEIGAIVVDEVHSISEKRRGVILELLLSKIMMYKKKNGAKIQIIAMSATLPNVPSLASWLDAAVYQTEFRPVELKETIKLDRQIFDVKEMKQIQEISEKQCPDLRGDAVFITLTKIINKQSTLIFFNNKEKCEKLALSISNKIGEIGAQAKPSGQRVREFIKQEDVSHVLQQLDSCIIRADETIKQCVRFGVGFHHAGLCLEHRAIIEEAFRSGCLKVLVATSTLSAGVNLPARNVLIKTPLFGNDMMNPLTYRQMIGRAGRKGIDDQGESILLCNQGTESELGIQLVKCETPPISSSIAQSSGNSMIASLQKAILEAVSIRLANDDQEIQLYLRSTFYFSSVDEKTRTSYQDQVDRALENLVTKNFIEKIPGDQNLPRYQVSQLGRACIAASIYPHEALRLLDSLHTSSQNLFIRNDLHLLFLIIPDSMASSTILKCESLSRVIETWHKSNSSPEYSKVAEVLKINYLKVMRNVSDKVTDINVAKFFLAAALSELIAEVPIHDLEKKYGVSKAVLQSLQNNSAAFASMVSSFCRELGWQNFQLLIENLQTRLEFGVKQELVNLMRIPCLNSRLARSLYTADLGTVIQVANATTQDILAAISVGKVYVTSPEKHYRSSDHIWIESKKMSMNLADISVLIQAEAREIAQLELPMNWMQENTTTAAPVSPVVKRAKRRLRSKTRSRTQTTSRNSVSGSNIVSGVPNGEAPACSSAEDATASSSFGSSQETITGDTFCTPKKMKVRPRNQLSPDDSIAASQCTDGQSCQRVMNLWNHYKRMSINLQLKAVSPLTSTIGQKMGAPAPFKASDDETLVDNKTLQAVYISFGGPNVYVFIGKENISQLSLAMKSQLEAVESGLLEIIVHKVLSVYRILRLALTLPRSLLTKIRWFDLQIACWFEDPESTPPSLPAGFIDRYLTSFNPTWRAIEGDVNTDKNIRLAFTTSLMIHLADELMSQVLSQGNMMATFHDIEMNASIVLAECSLHGFVVDKKYLDQLTQKMSQMHNQLIEKAYTIALEKFNIDSPKQIARILYHKFNLLEKACDIIDTNPIRVKKIKESKKLPEHLTTGRKVLEKLAKHHELPKVIVELRSINNVQTKTLNQIHKCLSESGTHDDILSPRFQLFTATGRVAMLDPDLMKTPRTFEVQGEPVNVRKLFTARDGFTLISADYSQLEMRVLAHVSQDTQLTDALNSGADVFCELASRINSCFVEDVTDEQRQQAKGISYGIIYGMGKREMSQRLGVSEEEASDIRFNFLKTLDAIEPFMERTINKCKETKYIETIGGRRRMLPAIVSPKEAERSKAKRQAINSTIQGSAADIAKAAMCKVDKAIAEGDIDAFLTLEMHDELIYQVKDESLHRFARILRKCMQQVTDDFFPDFKVKLIVNLKTGINWGEMTAFDVDSLTEASDH